MNIYQPNVPVHVATRVRTLVTNLRANGTDITYSDDNGWFMRDVFLVGPFKDVTEASPLIQRAFGSWWG